MEVFANDSASDPKGVRNFCPQKCWESKARRDPKKAIEGIIEIGFHSRQAVPSGQELCLILFQALDILRAVSGIEQALMGAGIEANEVRVAFTITFPCSHPVLLLPSCSCPPFHWACLYLVLTSSA
jgi:hypothetical protein